MHRLNVISGELLWPYAISGKMLALICVSLSMCKLMWKLLICWGASASSAAQIHGKWIQNRCKINQPSPELKYSVKRIAADLQRLPAGPASKTTGWPRIPSHPHAPLQQIYSRSGVRLGASSLWTARNPAACMRDSVVSSSMGSGFAAGCRVVRKAVHVVDEHA